MKLAVANGAAARTCPRDGLALTPIDGALATRPRTVSCPASTPLDGARLPAGVMLPPAISAVTSLTTRPTDGPRLWS